MELMTEEKKGFKRTEVGLIPEDWELIRIGDVFEFKNGLNKAKEFFGKGTPIINYMDVFRYPGLTEDLINGKVTLSKDEIRRFNVQKGDVFFTRTSETVDEIGISSVLEEDINDGVFSGFILRGRPISDRLGLKFKRYCFSSDIVRKQIISSATYTTRALTNGRHLSKVQLPVPSDEKEQQAIASALSDVDELIRSLDGLIQKKQAIKKGTMQQLLTGKKRLPGFDGEWEVKMVTDFGDVVTGGTPSTLKKEFWNGDIPWITPTDIGQLKDIYTSDRLISDQGVKQVRRLPKNSLLVTCIASIGKNAVLRRDGACNQQINAIIPSNSYDVDFLYYLIEQNKQKLLSNSGKTSTAILSKNKFGNIEFLMPEFEEQKAIAQILSDMDRELQTLRQKREKYVQIKQGMMQELLTGRVRLV